MYARGARSRGDANNPVVVELKADPAGTRAPAFAAPRPSPHRMNVAGALPAVVAVAVHAHPVVNYPATAGALAMLRAAASVQPDFVTSTSLLSHSAPEHRRQRHSPLSVADPRQPRLGCPHRGNIGDLRAHMVVVREAWAFIDACQAVEPLHRRIDPRRHITYARWQQQTLMHHLYNYLHTATRVQLDADGLDWILGWAISGCDTLKGGTPGMTATDLVAQSHHRRPGHGRRHAGRVRPICGAGL
jgi:hypothetical protein